MKRKGTPLIPPSVLFIIRYVLRAGRMPFGILPTKWNAELGLFETDHGNLIKTTRATHLLAREAGITAAITYAWYFRAHLDLEENRQIGRAHV